MRKERWSLSGILSGGYIRNLIFQEVVRDGYQGFIYSKFETLETCCIFSRNFVRPVFVRLILAYTGSEKNYYGVNYVIIMVFNLGKLSRKKVERIGRIMRNVRVFRDINYCHFCNCEKVIRF